MERIKQVIVLRKDLNMRKGKMVAQGAHASMGVVFNYITARKENSIGLENIPDDMMEWINGAFTKICLSVDSEGELIALYIKACSEELPCSMIIDKGLTEFNGVPTRTAIAIGPASSEEIDKITGHLKLL